MHSVIKSFKISFPFRFLNRKCILCNLVNSCGRMLFGWFFFLLCFILFRKSCTRSPDTVIEHEIKQQKNDYIYIYICLVPFDFRKCYNVADKMNEHIYVVVSAQITFGTKNITRTTITITMLDRKWIKSQIKHTHVICIYVYIKYGWLKDQCGDNICRMS